MTDVTNTTSTTLATGAASASEFSVTITISMRVHAAGPEEAKRLAREWLRETLYAASTGGGAVALDRVNESERTEASNSADSTPSARQRRRADEVWSRTAHEAEQRQKRRRARRLPGRQEVLALLTAAVTTEEYLQAGGALTAWLRAHRREEPYDSHLANVGYLLETLAEAIRWSEGHPNGPAIWNVGELLATIKEDVGQELFEAHEDAQDEPEEGAGEHQDVVLPDDSVRWR
jgi:hypothetical protein